MRRLFAKCCFFSTGGVAFVGSATVEGKGGLIGRTRPRFVDAWGNVRFGGDDHHDFIKFRLPEGRVLSETRPSIAASERGFPKATREIMHGAAVFQV
jgi:hypothetical protein